MSVRVDPFPVLRVFPERVDGEGVCWRLRFLDAFVALDVDADCFGAWECLTGLADGCWD